MFERNSNIRKLLDNPKLCVSFVSLALIYAVVIGLLYNWWDSYSVLAALAGVVIGWACGILLAPYEEEASKFSSWSKGLYGLVTGYFASRVEQAVSALPAAQKNALLVDGPFVRRFIIAGICALATTAGVFVARTYWQLEERQERTRAAKVSH